MDSSDVSVSLDNTSGSEEAGPEVLQGTDSEGSDAEGPGTGHAAHPVMVGPPSRRSGRKKRCATACFQYVLMDACVLE